MYSLAELQQLYLTTAQARATELGVQIDVSNLSDFQAKSSASAAIGASLSIDIERLFSEVVPQTSNALGCNAQLAARKASPQLPASPAFVTLTCNDVLPNQTYTIPTGTLLTSTNKRVYTTFKNTVITSDNNVLYCKSVAKGVDTGLNMNDVLTITPPIVSADTTSRITTCVVTASVDGTNLEPLANAIERLIAVYQSPLDNVRGTDYKEQAILFNDGLVTDAVVLTNRQINYPNTEFNGGVYLASGATITDDILNKGLVAGTNAVVYSRTSPLAVIDSTQQKFTSQYIMGSRPNVKTLVTQALTTNATLSTPFIKCIVTLQNGYTLQSNITLNNNNFTVAQLVQREIRRAVCAQPFGATLTIDVLTGELLASKLLISAIQNQLDVALGTSSTTGTLGAFLVDRAIFIKQPDNTYAQPSSISLDLDIQTSTATNLKWVYDISVDPTLIYPNIGVELAP